MYDTFYSVYAWYIIIYRIRFTMKFLFIKKCGNFKSALKERLKLPQGPKEGWSGIANCFCQGFCTLCSFIENTKDFHISVVVFSLNMQLARERNGQLLLRSGISLAVPKAEWSTILCPKHTLGFYDTHREAGIGNTLLPWLASKFFS